MFSAIRAALRPKSVRARLTLWYLLTLGVCLVCFAAFVYAVRAGTLYRELDADLQVRTHSLIDELRPTLLELDVGAGLSRNPHAADLPLLVREQPDRLLFRADAFPRLRWDAERDLAAAARQDTATIVAVQDRTGGSLRVFTAFVPRTGTWPLVVQLAAPTTGVRHILRQLAVTMALSIVIVLVTAAYGSGFTARRALAPVDEIVARVERIQAGAPGERLHVTAGTHEIDRLVTTLNNMLARLEQSTHGAHRFAADASHELQTPIAVMRAGVEMCACDEHAPPEYRQMAADLLLEIERLSALVRDLRLLALADAGHLFSTTEPVDLSAIAEDCCEVARALGEAKAITVQSRVSDDVVVAGNALHLRRALLNLAQNAIQYSPEASQIEIALRQDGGQAVVSVSDHGCGIPADDLPQIFERFYRSDAARARQTGGTGLGLAIVDQIVRLHGGRVEVRSVPGSGSTFTVYVPLAA